MTTSEISSKTISRGDEGDQDKIKELPVPNDFFVTLHYQRIVVDFISTFQKHLKSIPDLYNKIDTAINCKISRTRYVNLHQCIEDAEIIETSRNPTTVTEKQNTTNQKHTKSKVWNIYISEGI